MTTEFRAATVLGALGLACILTSCSGSEIQPTGQTRYLSYSRFTHPGERSHMLDVLPYGPEEIAVVAKNLTVHHNLLPYFGVPNDQWSEIRNVWPPKSPEVLAALAETGPRDLLGERQIKDRLRGACMSESHLLATMLRYRQIPVRIRAGYFKDVYTNQDHLIAFWEKNAREKGVAAQLLEEDPQRWRQVNHENTRQQIEINKYVEHWVTEYWDEETGVWQLLDANNTFLKAMSDIDVGFHLPRRYFEFAYESWSKMRSADDFNPDQYAEWPQDGRSHIRSQMLWDFYSLLNHDIAGYDRSAWPTANSMTAEREVYTFVKERKYEQLSADELSELDALARFLSRDPNVEELTAFYLQSRTLRIATLEKDSYSFPAR